MLNSGLGIDRNLKDTISQAITEAFKVLPQSIKELSKVDINGINNITGAISAIGTAATTVAT